MYIDDAYINCMSTETFPQCCGHYQVFIFFYWHVQPRITICGANFFIGSFYFYWHVQPHITICGVNFFIWCFYWQCAATHYNFGVNFSIRSFFLFYFTIGSLFLFFHWPMQPRITICGLHWASQFVELISPSGLSFFPFPLFLE